MHKKIWKDLKFKLLRVVVQLGFLRGEYDGQQRTLAYVLKGKETMACQLDGDISPIPRRFSPRTYLPALTLQRDHFQREADNKTRRVAALSEQTERLITECERLETLGMYDAMAKLEKEFEVKDKELSAMQEINDSLQRQKLEELIKLESNEAFVALRSQLAERDAMIKDLEADLSQRIQTIEELETEKAQLEAKLAESEAKVENLKAQVLLAAAFAKKDQAHRTQLDQFEELERNREKDMAKASRLREEASRLREEADRISENADQ